MIKKYFSNRYSVLDVLSLLLYKIKNKQPLSVIRLGDGEGRLLGYPDFVAKTGGAESLDHSLNIWFGHADFSKNSLVDLSGQLREAVENADVIGLPRIKQYDANIAYRNVYDAMEQFNLNTPSHIYTDAALHRYLQFGLFYKQILNGRDFLGLVTGRKNLATIIKDTFNIKHIESHLIPEEAHYSKHPVAEHFPNRFDELKDEIKVPYAGAVYLVGAGALGKIYCHWIKEAGGIAIDIGCICDSWSKEGRSMHEYNNIDHCNDPSFLLSGLSSGLSSRLSSELSSEKQSLEKQIDRYNYIVDDFNIDTTRITSDHLDAFITEHGK